MGEKQEIKLGLGTVISIIIVFILFLGIGFLFYDNSKLQSNTDNLSADVLQLTEELNAIRNNQMTNSNETSKENQTSENLKSSDSPNLTQSYSNKGITVKFPNNWIVDNSKIYEETAIFLAEKTDKTTYFKYIVIETPEELSKKYTLKEYATVMKNRSDEYGNLLIEYIDSEGEKTIGTITGYQITHTLKDADSTKITVFYTIKDNTLYTFHLSAQDEDIYANSISIMEEMIASIEM